MAVAKQQVENGAQLIDVNMDEAMLDSEGDHYFPEPGRFRTRHRACSGNDRQLQMVGDRGGFKVCSGKSVVNSISLKEGEEKFKHHARLVRRYGAAVVVMAFDERGQADTFERKRSLRAFLPDTHRANRLPASGHHFRSQCADGCHRHRGT